MKTKTLTTAATLAAAAFAAAAHADTVNMSFTGTGKGSNLRVTHFGQDTNTFIGQLKHTITAATGQSGPLVGEWRTFCADIDQTVSGNSSVFDVVLPAELIVRGAPLGAGKAAALSSLFAVQGAAATTNDASNDLGAAFQMAVWEILYDYNASAGISSINLTGGNISFSTTNGQALSNGVVNQFNTLLTAIGSGSATSSLLGLQSGARQDQLIYGPSVVPTPGATAIALCGGLMALRRRRPSR